MRSAFAPLGDNPDNTRAADRIRVRLPPYSSSDIVDVAYVDRSFYTTL